MSTPEGRAVCPDCYRFKARNADDCAAGDCSKWWAIRDKEADEDCQHFRNKTGYWSRERSLPTAVPERMTFDDWWNKTGADAFGVEHFHACREAWRDCRLYCYPRGQNPAEQALAQMSTFPSAGADRIADHAEVIGNVTAALLDLNVTYDGNRATFTFESTNNAMVYIHRARDIVEERLKLIREAIALRPTGADRRGE